MTRSVADLLRDVLQRVTSRCPEAMREATRAARGLRLAARIDGETIVIVVGADAVRVQPSGAASVEVTLARSTARALLGGDDSTVDAVRAGRLFVRGGVNDLVRLDDFVHALLVGAARLPETEDLLDELHARE